MSGKLKKSLFYLSADMGSAHWYKRVSWLEGIGMSVSPVGFGFRCNQSLEHLTSPSFCVLSRRWFILRVICSLFFFIASFRKLKSGAVVVRGFEFEVLCALFGVSFIVEYSDINPRQKNGSILYRVQQWVFRKSLGVAVTSPAFLTYFGYEQNTLRFVWHNLPPSSHSETNLSFDYRKRKIVYCGFLRNFDNLSRLGMYSAVDVYGTFNLLGNDQATFEELCSDSVIYHGPYSYDEVSNIYGQYLFAYVDDEFNQNSQFNLTNRLYESVLAGCLPIARASDSFLSNFMAVNDIGILYSSYEGLPAILELSKNDVAHRVVQSQNNLMEVVLDDHVIAENAFHRLALSSFVSDR